MNFFRKLFLKHVIIEQPTPIKDIDIALRQNYYQTDVTCNNCGQSLHLLIKKGLYVKYEISTIRCTNCGCKIDRGEAK